MSNTSEPGAANTPARLVPFKTAAGYWVFTTPAEQPAGSTPGALVRGASHDTFVTTTTDGLRLTRTPTPRFVLD